jgi:hypothetical protein
VNVLGAPDTPVTVIGVHAPGTITDMHPPWSPDVKVSKRLSVNVKLDFSVVVALAKILNAPPSPPADPLMNVDVVMSVVIAVYVPAIKEIDPPLDADPAVHELKVQVSIVMLDVA